MNCLIEKYKEVKQALKERGNNSFGKEMFFDCVYSRVPKRIFEEIIDENTPKEYFVCQAMQTNEEIKDKLFRMVKNEI